MRRPGFTLIVAPIAVLLSACATVTPRDLAPALGTNAAAPGAAVTSRVDSRIDAHWVKPGTDTMIMTRAGDVSSVSFHRSAEADSPGRQEIGMTIQTVRTVTDQQGRRAFEVAFEQREADAIVARATTWVDALTLLPIRQEAQMGAGRVVTLVYGSGQALGVDMTPGQPTHGFNTTVPDSAYTAGAIDLLLRALPLAADYRTAVPVYFPADQAMFNIAVRVVGRETLKTRGGRAADCWLVAADFPGGVTEQFWVDAQDHTMIRILAHDSPTSLVRYDR